jgi:acyl-CoA reductase-like NAD-dependent aldehyde dehydrogenase
MDCAERTRLWAEFKAKLAELNEKIARISTRDIGGVFEEALMAVQQAGRDCDHAQRLWEEHMQEHTCDVHVVAGDEGAKRRSKRNRAETKT